MADDSENNSDETVLRFLLNAEDASADALNHISDSELAQFVAGSSSDAARLRIDQLLRQNETAAETMTILRELLQATPSGVDPTAELQWLQTGLTTHDVRLPECDAALSDLLTHVRGLDRIVCPDDELFSQMHRAMETDQSEVRYRCGDVILDYDPLFSMAAGEVQEPVDTSPLWYSRVLYVPRDLWWNIPPTGAFQVVATVDGQVVFEVETVRASVTLPAENIPVSRPVTWKVKDSNGVSVVESVFEVLSDDEISELENKVDLPRVRESVLENELADCIVMYEHGLLHDLTLKLQGLDDLFSAGLPRFVIHRSLATVHSEIARRISGEPFWLGDREGLWATQRATEFLRSAWAALGVDYHV